MFNSSGMFDAVNNIVSPVYMVGGSVRDIILGKEPKDYDFTTPLSPEVVEAKVKEAGRRTYLIGKKFGTIGFKVQDKTGKYQYVEVTTFRSELYNPGSRKPEVQFVTDLQEDLSRRDFTINSIAYDGEKYIDPFGGRLDIIERKIKAVGKAKVRFREDPLRMLRAARFAAQLNFQIDPNMIGAIRAMAEKIAEVSRERWVQEIDKLLVADNFAAGLLILRDSYLLRYILPELWVTFTEYPALLQLIIGAVEAQPANADKRWAALLLTVGMITAKKHNKDKISYPHHEIIGVELASGICARLKFSRERTTIILQAVKNQNV